MSAIRVWKPILVGDANCKSQSVSKTMKSVAATLLRPTYQRDICWNLAMMCDLMLAVMCNGIIPPITLYKYQVGDAEFGSGDTHECVDGQHRLFSLQHFYKGEFVDKRKRLISIRRVEDDGTTTHLFYKNTQDVASWVAANPKLNHDFLTEDEREVFNGYMLDIKEINGLQTIDERRRLFLALSKGRPVTGCDLEKNYTHLPLVRFISDEMGWETKMKALICEKSYVKASKFWLHWAIRFFRLMRDDRTDSFMITDRDVKCWLKADNVSELSIAHDEKEEFQTKMEDFFVFIKDAHKMSPTHLFALWVVRNRSNFDADKKLDADNKLRSWTPSFNTNNMWEKNNDKSMDDAAYQNYRREFYLAVVQELSAIDSFRHGQEKRNIGRKLKQEVWVKCNGDAEEGFCFCCKDVLSKRDSVCAHIKSKRDGGYNTIDNLRATCFGCNSGMGTNNMKGWMVEKGYEYVEL